MGWSEGLDTDFHRTQVHDEDTGAAARSVPFTEDIDIDFLCAQVCDEDTGAAGFPIPYDNN